MKRSNLALTLLTSIMAINLSGCDFLDKIPFIGSTETNEEHVHKDLNNDHLCDGCGAQVSNHVDTDNNHICDVCEFKLSDHSDVNKDTVCDVCGEIYSANDNSVKGKLLKVVTSKNYTIEYKGDYLVGHSYFFTPNSISRYSESRPDYDNTYYYDGLGTYQINYDIDRFVSSVYRSVVTPWKMKNAVTLYEVAVDYFNSLDNDVAELQITSKSFKLAFLQILGYEIADFVNLASLKASLDADSNLVFDMKYDSRDYTYVVKNFNETVDIVVDEYVVKGGGTVYSVSKEWNSINSAFKRDNYVQGIYNFGETEETTGYIGYNFFTPGYFYYKYFSSEKIIQGYISVNLKETEEYPATFGIYQFAMDESTNPAGVYMGSQVSDSTDITYIMAYPKCLTLWSNLQFLRNYKDTTLDVGFDVSDNAQVTTEATIVYDFSNNFGMDSAFSGQRPFALTIDYEFQNSQVYMVTFYYTFTYGGYLYTMPFPFFNFGNAKSNLIDQLYNNLND